MIKEALEYLFSKQAKFEMVEDMMGNQYVGYDGHHFKVKEEMINQPFSLTTLQGVVDYIVKGVDSIHHDHELTIHIVGPSKVEAYTDINSDLRRSLVLTSEALLSQFKMGQWYDTETFMIHLLSNFVETADLKTLLKLIGTISIEDGITTEDDGITQNVTARKGIKLKDREALPSRVKLSPIRTFIEVEQPISDFVFRVKEYGGEIQCSLHQADGGYWRIEAMENIKKYLQLHAIENFDKSANIKILM